jgi:pimeloyl-ACP methyl ester carboxylesterase
MRLAEDARVLCIDFPGRGGSEWLTTSFEYNFTQFVADARTLLAQQGLKNVDWIGTSMGGLLGMLLASQPSSPIRRLLMNDIGAFVPMDALQEIGRGLQAPESFASLDEVEAHLRRTRAEWGAIADAEWKAMALHNSRPVRPGSSRLRMHFDPRIAELARPLPLALGLFFWDAWYRVRCPVLLMRGERSRVLPANVARTMLDVRPHARLAEIPGCGHVPSLMTEEQVTLVRDFLQDGGVESEEPRRAPQPAYPPRAA